MDKRHCQTCRFRQRDGSWDRCHRFPPQVGTLHEFPIIRLHDWCGEWQRKPVSLQMTPPETKGDGTP